MSFLPNKIKFIGIDFGAVGNPHKIALASIFIGSLSLLGFPLYIYIPFVLVCFYAMILSWVKLDRRGFYKNLLIYLSVSTLFAFRYFPESIGWELIVLAYALFVYGLGGICIIFIVLATGVIRNYAPESKFWDDKNMNLVEYLFSYFALFLVGSFRLYSVAIAIILLSLPIIFACSENNSLICSFLTPYGTYLESIATWSYITKTFLYITIAGGLINYFIYFVRKKSI